MAHNKKLKITALILSILSFACLITLIVESIIISCQKNELDLESLTVYLIMIASSLFLIFGMILKKENWVMFGLIVNLAAGVVSSLSSDITFIMNAKSLFQTDFNLAWGVLFSIGGDAAQAVATIAFLVNLLNDNGSRRAFRVSIISASVSFVLYAAGATFFFLKDVALGLAAIYSLLNNASFIGVNFAYFHPEEEKDPNDSVSERKD